MSKQISINSQKVILDSLKSSQIKVKFAMLQAIVNFPNKVLSYIDNLDTTLVDYLYEESLSIDNIQILKLHIQALYALDKKRSRKLIMLLWNRDDNIKKANVLYSLAIYLTPNQKYKLGINTIFSNVPQKSYFSAKLLSNFITKLNFKEHIRYLLIISPKEIQYIQNEKLPLLLVEELNLTYKMQVIEAIRYIDEKYLKEIMKKWDLFSISIKIELSKIIFDKDEDNIQSIIIKSIFKKTAKNDIDSILMALKDY